MLVSFYQRLVNTFRSAPPPPVAPGENARLYDFGGAHTKAGRLVTPEESKTVATAYRCANIISDDISQMPFQEYEKAGRDRRRTEPNAVTRNMAYLLEIAPNRWMTPVVFKKTIVDWVLWWGNGYIWNPPGPYPELFILDADRTFPVFDLEGSLWYKTVFPNGKTEHIPAVEVMHLMINPVRGLYGRGVITFARETFARQLAASETRDSIAGTGFNPAAVITAPGDLQKEARGRIREAYIEGVEAGGVLILDSKISKFEPVQMKPSDAQFLEGVTLTDGEICNFFGMPLYKLNRGKESYESNEQRDLDYLRSTLNPHLVQWEQSARLKWVPLEYQPTRYWRFERDSLLWMDAKSRSEVIKNRVLSGSMEINEARQIEDAPIHPGGDVLLIPSNMAVMDRSGKITAISAKPATPPQEDSNA